MKDDFIKRAECNFRRDIGKRKKPIAKSLSPSLFRSNKKPLSERENSKKALSLFLLDAGHRSCPPTSAISISAVHEILLFRGKMGDNNRPETARAFSPPRAFRVYEITENPPILTLIVPSARYNFFLPALISSPRSLK